MVHRATLNSESSRRCIPQIPRSKFPPPAGRDARAFARPPHNPAARGGGRPVASGPTHRGPGQSRSAPRGALGGGVRGSSGAALCRSCVFVLAVLRLSLLRERRACRILIVNIRHTAPRDGGPHRRPHTDGRGAGGALVFGPRGWRNLVSESSAPYRHELSAARSQALRHALNERVHSESHVRLTSVRPKISQGSEISLPLRLSASSTSLKSSAELRSASNES